MALIELDRTAEAAPAPGSLPPARHYRGAGLLLAVVLLLTLGGAAPPTVLQWRWLGTVPVSMSSDAPFRLDGDRVYTVTGEGAGRVVTAWSLEAPPHQLWKVRFPARVIGPDQVAFGSVGAVRAGAVVLLSDGPAVTAIDANSGVPLWDSPLAVQRTEDRTGLVQEPKFRAGTLYDQDSGAPGALYFSGTGEPHTEPPSTTDLHGVDLHTGATLWTATQPGSVQAFATDAGVLVLSVDRLTLLATTTGTVLRQAVLPAIAGESPTQGQLVGDELLVSYGTSDSKNRTLAAYGISALTRRWLRSEPPVSVDPGTCTGLACADASTDHAGTDHAGTGQIVLDQKAGREIWRVPSGLDVTADGGYAVETSGNPARPVRLVQADNGDPVLDLGRWSSVTVSDGSLLLRRSTGRGVAAFDVVTGVPAEVRSLGSTHGAVSDCSATDRYVVCHAASELQVYAYR